jgi:hypothetical protein
MAKATLSDPGSLANVIATIIRNNDELAAAFDNTLFRDGTSPNEMEANLDMNSNRILNLPAAGSNGEPVRLQEFEAAILGNYNPSADAWTFVQSGTGASSTTMQNKARLIIHDTDFGAVADWNGSTGTDNGPLIEKAIEAADARGGGTVIITRGSKKVSTTIDVTITNNVTIEFEAGAKLVVPAAFNTNVFDIDATVNYTLSLIMINPTIDMSLGTSAVVNSAISVSWMKMFIVENCNLYAGTDPGGTAADTGISTVGCRYQWIKGGVIQGFNDAGYYPNGDNVDAMDDSEGLFALVEGTFFQNCNNGITPKRDLWHLKVLGAKFYKCNAGIVCAEQAQEIPVSSGNWFYTGSVRRMDVIGCTFREVLSNNIRLRGEHTSKFFIVGNTFEDWGYTYLEALVTSQTYALYIVGAQKAYVANNTFRVGARLAASNVYQNAVYLDNIELWEGTANAVWKNQGNHTFRGNHYEGDMNYAIVEGRSDAGADTTVGDPSQFFGEHFEGITDLINSTFNVGSIIIYTQDASTRVWFRTGPTTTRVLGNVVAVTVDLTSLGTVGATTSTGTQTTTATGALAGDEVHFVRLSSNLALNPQILLSGRTAADQVQWVLRNNSGSGFNCTGESLKLVVMRNG